MIWVGDQSWKVKHLAMCIGLEEGNIGQELDIKYSG